MITAACSSCVQNVSTHLVGEDVGKENVVVGLSLLLPLLWESAVTTESHKHSPCAQRDIDAHRTV